MAAHVLIVDDEPAIAEAAGFALRREGFAVSVAGTLAAARAALSQPGIAAVVLDVGLPDGSGFDFCREVRARNAQLPVLFLSARGEDVDRIVGLELGADDYLAKPFSPRELAARVRAVLRRSAAPPAQRQDHRDDQPLRIDAERCQVFVHGVPIDLPRMPFRLLCALARAPGRVWSRDALLEACCDEPDARFDRAIDSQIRHLRLALRQAGCIAEAVRTVRGEGYALAEGLCAPVTPAASGRAALPLR